MESAQNLTDLPPDTSCQIHKYQLVTDILDPLGLGVKVSFAILDSSGVLKPSNSRSIEYTVRANGCLSYCAILTPAKKGKLDDAIISLTNWGSRYHRLPD